MKSVIGQFFKNIFTIYIGMIIGIIITFFLTPYLVNQLGKEQYGVWQLAFSILAYMGLADVGMKQSIVRYISKHYATRDWHQLNQVFSSSVRVYGIIASVIFVAAMAIAFGVIQHFQLPEELVNVARYTFLFLGLDQVLTYLFIPFTALGAFHRFDITNAFRVGRQIVQTVLIVLLLEMGYGLIEMAAMVVGLNLISQLGMNYLRTRMFSEMKFSRKLIDSGMTKLLLHYGVFSFLIVITWIVIFQTDNIVIGWFVSVEAVAMYSVAAALVAQVRSAIGVLATPLVPTISHLEAGQQFELIRALYRKSTRYLYYISGFLTIIILYFGGPFILLWLDASFTDSIEIMHILIISSAFYLPQTICNSVLLGISRHKVAFYILGAEAVSNIILSIILVKTIGLVGVAIGTALPQLVIYIFVYPVVFHRVIKDSVGRFYLTSLKSLAMAALVVTPTAYIMKTLITPDSWGNWAIDCAVVTLVMLAVMYSVVVEKEDRLKIESKIRSLLGR
ncbi:MAG: oligosaccharide flippase family protein [bacterium]|nr:oligosaccharide flippase family protein [bacterium]